MKNKQTYSVGREVIGGKSYEGGNHVWVYHRRIDIEFNSDYYISREFNGKNWFKKACKVAESIPNPVTVEWLSKHEFEVPKEIFKYL